MRSRTLSDQGAGLIGSIAGVTVFLLLLMFAVQLLFNLYATSAVSAVAHDAAREVAGSVADGHEARSVELVAADAEARAKQTLGRYGDRLEFDWQIDGRRVRLHVGATHPRVAIGAMVEPFGLNRVDRTVEVRIEEVR